MSAVGTNPFSRWSSARGPPRMTSPSPVEKAAIPKLIFALHQSEITPPPAVLVLVCGAKCNTLCRRCLRSWPRVPPGSVRSRPWPANLPSHPRFRDLRQVVGHHPPSDPPTHTALAVVPAPLQPIIAPQHVDPAL